MLSKRLVFAAALVSIFSHASAKPYQLCPQQAESIQVKYFLNVGTGFNMVSSLIIGSDSAVLVGVPIGVPHAEVLADWIRNTTDKPLVAIFTTHHHPDHNLGARVILDQFDQATFFASAKATEHLVDETPVMSERMRAAFGRENITDNPALPSIYPNTFFTLQGHENEPIHLLNNVVGDTVDTTMMWIPSQRIIIAGDAVYHRDLHLWLADMETKALIDSWLNTLDFITALKPSKVITGHAGNLKFDSNTDIDHSRRYIHFFQNKVFSRGQDFFTPAEITKIFTAAYPKQLEGSAGWSSGMFLNNTAGKFGRDSGRLPDILDMRQFNNSRDLQNWKMGF